MRNRKEEGRKKAKERGGEAEEGEQIVKTCLLEVPPLIGPGCQIVCNSECLSQQNNYFLPL